MTQSARPGPKTGQHHPGRRNQVLAAADAEIRQVQIIDQHSRERQILVYRCGPDVFYATTMDRLFDIERRRKAPDWLVEGLDALPDTVRFRADGTSYAAMSGASAKKERPAEKKPTNDDLVFDDDDVPGVRQA